MTYEQYTVDQLVDASTDLNDRVDALFTRLAHIESTASTADIEATVNLEGRLTALTLSPAAMSLPPEILASEIFRLTQEASATALAEGLAALPPVAGEDLTAELTALIDARPQPAPAPTPEPSSPPHRPQTLDDSEDFSDVRTWAVPR